MDLYIEIPELLKEARHDLTRAKRRYHLGFVTREDVRTHEQEVRCLRSMKEWFNGRRI
jgi:hypothetical protein